MATFVVRIWLPDRPGALGAVASRIGAVRGDLVGIDILERGAGMAIDELVVELSSEALVPLLLQELGEVDGVAVEEVRAIGSGGLPDPRVAALDTAALLTAQGSPAAVMIALATEAARDFEAGWVAVIDEERVVHASHGELPPAAWIAAFVAGGRSSRLVASGAAGPDDMAWVDLPAADLALVLARPGRPFRGRERRQLAALARIADLRWTELMRISSLRMHPSVV